MFRHIDKQIVKLLLLSKLVSTYTHTFLVVDTRMLVSPIRYGDQATQEFLWKAFSLKEDFLQWMNDYDKHYRQYPDKLAADCSEWGIRPMIDPVNVTELQDHLHQLGKHSNITVKYESENNCRWPK